MKTILNLFALVALTTAASAHAELKPANALVTRYCGNLNRSEELCVARTATGSSYIVIRTFLNRAPVRYIKTTEQVQMAYGATTRQFAGTGVVERDGYEVEVSYKLQLTEIIVPSRPIRAMLTVIDEAGEQSGREFPMEHVATPQ